MIIESLGGKLRCDGRDWDGTPTGWIELAPHRRWIYVQGYVLQDGRFLRDEEAARHVAGLMRGEDAPSDELLLGLNGGFSIVVADSDGAISLRSDRFATTPLYHHLGAASGVFSVSDSAMELARHVRAPLDIGAALALAAMEFVPGDTTLAAGVHELRAGSALAFRQGAVTLRSWWRPRLMPDAEADEAALEKELALILNTVADEWSEGLRSLLPIGAPVYIPLSGGLDSRLLAALFSRRLGNRAQAVCYGDPLSQDVRYSRAAAAALGMEHRLVAFTDGSFLSPERRRLLAESIGLTTRLTLADGGLRLSEEFLPAEGPAVFLPGHSGDILSGSRLHAGLQGLRTGADVAALMSNRWTCFRAPLLEKLLRPEHLHLAGSTGSQLAGSCALVPSGDAMETAQEWLLYQLVWRRVLTESIVYRRRALPMLPFFDSRLADFFGRIPRRFLYNQRVYTNTILRRVFRDHAVARVPLQGRGVLSPVGDANKRHSLRYQTRRATNRLLRALAPLSYERRVSSCPMVALWRRDAEMRESVLGDIERSSVLPHLFQMDRLKDYLRSSLGRDDNLTTLGVWGLLTIEYAGQAIADRPGA